MRPKLLACDPVKNSSRQVLENDLGVLASACNHTVPKGDNPDLRKKKNDRNLYLSPESSSQFLPQTSPSRDGGAIPRRQKDLVRRRTRSPPSHKGTGNKDKGAQWRQSLAGRENRYFPADLPVSPTVPLSSPPSRFSPYRRNSPSCHEISPAYGRSMNYSSTKTSDDNNNSYGRSFHLDTQEAARSLINLCHDSSDKLQ